MADSGDSAVPGSPPLPRKGTYNIDFDALDDSFNPFQSTSNVSLGSSPPIKPSAGHAFDPSLGEVDPFKPKNGIQNSPVGSLKENSFINNNGLPASDKPPSPTLKGLPEEITRDQTDPVSKTIPKKKKIIKKPKVQSKIKAPKQPSPQSSEYIEIFVPANISNTDVPDGRALPLHADLSNEEQFPPPPPCFFDEEQPTDLSKPRPSSYEEDVPCDPVPEAMVSSSEMDTQFVNKDDIDDLTPSGICDTKKVNQSSVKEDITSSNNISNDTSPTVKKSPKNLNGEECAKDKHPAARVLEAASNPTIDALNKSADVKNESSSEENTFYDAPEFPPTTSPTSKLGQKKSTPTMPASISSHGLGDGGNNGGGTGKGTVVQLVQEERTGQVLRYSQSDWNKLKQELELGFQASLLNKEREWSALLGERDKRLEQMEDSNKKLKQTNEDMRSVVAEFEKTISQLQADKERHKKDLSKTTADLENERDQAIEDLQSVESAFSDLHKRYEKSKGIIEGFKKNQEQLKEHMEDLQEKLAKSESKLIALRQQAEEKLDRANEDIEQIKRSTKSDVARLEAALKKSEIRICTLDESLQRKEKENQELTAICDELIAKVGS